jgi:glycosyl transferase family 25
MTIHVISLARTPERLRHFMKSNQHLRVDVFNAIDGASVDTSSTRIFDPECTASHWTRGAIGNYLSHVSLWERVSVSNEEMTICEDDAILSNDFIDVSTRLLKNIENWDFILWGWNFDSVLWCNLLPNISSVAMIFDQNSLRHNISSFPNSIQNSRLYRLHGAYGIPCYSISPAGAQKILRNIKPIKSKANFMPILNRSVTPYGLDGLLNSIYPQIDAMVCFPPLSVTPNHHEISTVQKQNKPKPLYNFKY